MNQYVVSAEALFDIFPDAVRWTLYYGVLLFMAYWTCFRGIARWSVARSLARAGVFAFFAAFAGLALVYLTPGVHYALARLLGGRVMDRNPEGYGFNAVVALATVFILPAFAIPLLADLNEKWRLGRMSEAERQPGAAGVRAWLTGRRMALAIAIALCVQAGYGYSFWVVAPLILALLAARPLWLALQELLERQGAKSEAAREPEASETGLENERMRVLRLLEEGRISGEECAELLTALNESARLAPERPPLSRGRRLIVLGALLVGVGFVLPWYSINLGALSMELRESVAKMMPPGWLDPGRMPAGNFLPGMDGGVIRITGGDAGEGMGWLILIFAAATASLPLWAGRTHPADLRRLSFVLLAVGSAFVLYLIARQPRFVSIGLALAALGYALEWAGLATEPRGREGTTGSA